MLPANGVRHGVNADLDVLDNATLDDGDAPLARRRKGSDRHVKRQGARQTDVAEDVTAALVPPEHVTDEDPLVGEVDPADRAAADGDHRGRGSVAVGTAV